MSLIWIAVAIVGYLTLKKISTNKFFLICLFGYLAFFPSAFDDFLGVRIYREMIIIPAVFFLIFGLLNLIFISFSKEEKGTLKLLIWSFFTGFSLLFAFYIKESGLWMLLLCLLVSFILLAREIFLFLRNKQKNRISSLVFSLIVLLLPLGIYQAGTEAYKTINDHYFGVYEINTRTEGEVGKFVNNLYKIDANNRSASVWAPPAAVEKAFAVSPTLRSIPTLKNNILHADWSGETYDGMTAGDFLTWILRIAVVKSTGNWNEAKEEAFFKKVNNEIDVAFRTNELQRPKGRYQIVSSTGGYTINEIKKLPPITLAVLRNDFFMYGYKYTNSLGDVAPNVFPGNVANILNVKPLNNGDMSGKNVPLYNHLIKLYQLINPILLVIAFLSLVLDFIKSIRKRQFSLYGITSFTLLAGGVVLSFALSWFIYFLIVNRGADFGVRSLTMFYGVDASPLLICGILIPIALLFNLDFINKRKRVLK
jgi:hypothetical protein